MKLPGQVGIIGCGDLTIRGVLPHLAEPDARGLMNVAAVCDVDGPRAKATATRFGVARWFADYKDLLEDPGVDVVLILTPTACHAEQAIAALERGKHVYLQKPMAANLRDAERVLAAAERSTGRLLVAPVWRVSPLIERLSRTVQENRLGTVFWALTATHSPPTYGGSGFNRSWHYSPAGGPVRDRTIYSLTALTDLFGPARRVTAMSSVRIPVRHAGERDGYTGPFQVRTADNAVLLLEFADGVLGVASGNYCAEGAAVPTGFIGVYGSGGCIETVGIDAPTFYPTRLQMMAGGQCSVIDSPVEQIPGLSGAHARLPEAQVYADLVHFVNCLRDNRDFMTSTAQPFHMVEIVEKAYLAAETGIAQELCTTFSPVPVSSVSR